MHQEAAGFLVQLPREASNGQRNLPRHSQIQNITGYRSCLCTRSPSAVSGQCQRCQRPLASQGQCYLKSLALGRAWPSLGVAVPNTRNDHGDVVLPATGEGEIDQRATGPLRGRARSEMRLDLVVVDVRRETIGAEQHDAPSCDVGDMDFGHDLLAAEGAPQHMLEM